MEINELVISVLRESGVIFDNFSKKIVTSRFLQHCAISAALGFWQAFLFETGFIIHHRMITMQFRRLYKFLCGSEE